MWTAQLQLQELWRQGHLHWFLVFFALTWVAWALKRWGSGRYTPFEGDAEFISTAVVIPVVDEDLDLFAEVLHRVRIQRPDEVVVVINGPRNVALQEACDSAGVRWYWTPHPGKRGAVAIGVQRTSSDVVVLIDSDTLLGEDCIAELKRPFVDGRVGGATTQQHILLPELSFLTTLADWLEGIRNHFSFPAFSVAGQIGCLPGRAIALRRKIVEDHLEEFLTETFLGVHVAYSDDRSLTNYTLMDGYRTVYQSTAHAWTDAPSTWKKFVRQQLRWARGSQWNNLRMLPHYRRHRWLLVQTVWETLVPFLVFGLMIGALHNLVIGEGALPGSLVMHLTFGVLGFLAGLFIRQAPTLLRHPSRLRRFPAMAAVLAVAMPAIRVAGFVTMTKGGWGTREGAAATVASRPWQAKVVPPVLAAALLAFGVGMFEAFEILFT